MAIDILVVGAHADDAELGCGGIIARSAGEGKRVCIIDVTDGSLATNMDKQTRAQAAEQSASALGAMDRINLGLPDRNVTCTEQTLSVCVRHLRRLQPQTLLIPDPGDRHPDHEATYHLWREAIFSAGLARYGNGDPFRPERVYTYGVSPGVSPPQLLVDVSEVHEIKVRAMGCYQQLVTDTSFAASRSGSIDLVTARDRYYGKLVGVKYAEAISSQGPIVIGTELL